VCVKVFLCFVLRSVCWCGIGLYYDSCALSFGVAYNCWYCIYLCVLCVGDDSVVL
jgi:hypothetical protein